MLSYYLPELTSPQNFVPCGGESNCSYLGPGCRDLLTIASLEAITSADLVLAHKLVPAPVLGLVPCKATAQIVRKFPGNPGKSQEELLSLGLYGL
jgi:uroporphyrin-III C-methyltransferase